MMFMEILSLYALGCFSGSRGSNSTCTAPRTPEPPDNLPPGLSRKYNATAAYYLRDGKVNMDVPATEYATVDFGMPAPQSVWTMGALISKKKEQNHGKNQ